MRARRLGLVLGVVVLACGSAASARAMAAGSVVVTTSNVGGGVAKYSVAWTSSAGGAVSANAFAVRAGRLIAVKFVPASAGDAPTDQYDVTLVDTDSVDLLDSRGANLSNTASSMLLWDPPLYRDATQTLDVVVANAGNAKSGTVILWVQ